MENAECRNGSRILDPGSSIRDPGFISPFGIRHSSLTMAPAKPGCCNVVRVYVGTAGWNIPRAHKARFPEAGTGLQRYAARLNAAEINTSFYRPHAPSVYARWAASVPPAFRFAVKMPRSISHDRALTRAKEPLDRFLSEVRSLGGALGVLLLQLPPSHAFDARRVGRFFELLRGRFDGNVVCEPRHATWTTESASRLLVKFRVARV